MVINDKTLPSFLGVSQRAARRNHAWDLLGVSKLLIFPFFPQRLVGLQCLIGIDPNSLLDVTTYSCKIYFTDQSQPDNYAWNNFELKLDSQDAVPEMHVEKGGFAVAAGQSGDGQSMYGFGMFAAQELVNEVEIIPTVAPPLVLLRPCSVLVEFEMSGKRYQRGTIHCGFAPPPPLTSEERRALASRPDAIKVIVSQLHCSSCKSEINFYDQLNPGSPRPQNLPSTAMSIHEAPQQWACGCGKLSIDLTYLKQGLHDLFRRTMPHANDDIVTKFTPLYEAGRIQNVVADFEQLIETDEDEETIQKYLEDYPVFWSFLSPVRILHKPPVLTKKKADFGIVSTQKVLYLIEIEKPSTKLTNQDGSISAEIQKGANQIRDWQLVVGDHRLALLSELNLKDLDIQEIRYVLIGGLARRTSLDGLRKLRRTPFANNTDFYCYDELGSFLRTLAVALQQL